MYAAMQKSHNHKTTSSILFSSKLKILQLMRFEIQMRFDAPRTLVV